MLYNKYYVDQIYDAMFVNRAKDLALTLGAFDVGVINGLGVDGAGWLTRDASRISMVWDKWIVDGLVNLAARIVWVLSYPVRMLQSGRVSQLRAVIVLGVLIFLGYYLHVAGRDAAQRVALTKKARTGDGILQYSYPERDPVHAAGGGVVLLFVPRDSENAHRVIGNLFGFLGLIVSLPLIWRFSLARRARYQFRETHDWIPSIGAHYSLGIDGISLLLVMLTTLLGAISILSSWSAIKMRTKEYYILFLLLQVGMLGVFMSLDFFLFYHVLGSDARADVFPDRRVGQRPPLYAAIKFFLYTLVGSVLMLLGILALYFTGAGGVHVRHSHAAGVRPAVLDTHYAGAAVLGVLLRLRDQGADVPVPHLAARRAHRSAHGRLRHPGGRSC